MMKKRGLIITVFTIGLLMLIGAFAILLFRVGNRIVSEREFALSWLLSILAVATIVLAITGITDTGKERWLAFTLVAVLILGFSVYLFDIGLIFWHLLGWLYLSTRFLNCVDTAKTESQTSAIYHTQIVHCQ